MDNLSFNSQPLIERVMEITGQDYMDAFNNLFPCS